MQGAKVPHTNSDTAHTNSDTRGCSQCGGPLEGGPQTKFCATCRRGRRAETFRAAMIQYWEQQRRCRPDLRPHPCALDGCGRLVPGSRRYCSRAHYGLSERGPRPERRRRLPVQCDECGAFVGERPPGWIAKARRHFCDLHRSSARQAVWKGKSRCARCGKMVRPGSQFCRACYLRLGRRGPYSKTAERDVVAAFQQCQESGEPFTRMDVAWRAGVARSTVYEVLRRRADEAKTQHEPSAAAYKRHLRRAEMPCRDCREANRIAARTYKAEVEAHREAGGARPDRRRRPFQHGTTAGYERHRWLGEQPCGECRSVYNEQRRARAQQKGRRPRVRPDCGSEGGYAAHLRRNETPCDACRTAHSAYDRDYRERNRERLKQYRERNRERRNEYARGWARRNRAKARGGGN
jgi:hypothetical protein